MTAWNGTAYRYFSVDSADDISTDPLKLGTDGTTYPLTAEYVTDPPPRLAQLKPAAAAGLTRYWWRYLCGVGTDLPLLEEGLNVVYGQIVDAPETLPHVWRFRV